MDLGEYKPFNLNVTDLKEYRDQRISQIFRPDPEIFKSLFEIDLNNLDLCCGDRLVADLICPFKDRIHVITKGRLPVVEVTNKSGEVVSRRGLDVFLRDYPTMLDFAMDCERSVPPLSSRNEKLRQRLKIAPKTWYMSGETLKSYLKEDAALKPGEEINIERELLEPEHFEPEFMLPNVDYFKNDIQTAVLKEGEKLPEDCFQIIPGTAQKFRNPICDERGRFSIMPDELEFEMARQTVQDSYEEGRDEIERLHSLCDYDPQEHGFHAVCDQDLLPDLKFARPLQVNRFIETVLKERSQTQSQTINEGCHGR